MLYRNPDLLFSKMKETVNSLLETRIKTREIWDALSEINNDASGICFTNNYNDPEIIKTRELLYNLDHEIGNCFRAIEYLQKELEKKRK